MTTATVIVASTSLCSATAYGRLLDLEALRTQAVGDVEVGHRTKQATIDASLALDAHDDTGEFLGVGLRIGQLRRGRLLEFGPLRLELLQSRRRRPPSLAGRNQEIARVAVTHLEQVAKVAEVGDLLHQNDLHRRLPAYWWLSVYGSSARKRARLIATDNIR